MKQAPHYNGHYFEVPMVSALERLHCRYLPRKFIENAAKGTQTPNQCFSSVETRHFVVYINMYMIHMIYIYDIYHILLTCFWICIWILF